jgi:nitroimidazol reductase NimA-like FMN-containing flavoprotein (pyridoxamine 5'-phosphate oxidase superfamily)
MAVLDPRTWMEILPDAECWRLLRLSTIGRLAMVVDGDPTIWPLNIAVDDRAIVFRTGHGSKLGGLDRLAAGGGDGPRVAVEVDGLDFEARRGWSVVAVGRARALGGDDLVRARALPLAPWTASEKPRWFAVDVERISGRAIGDRAAG